MRRGFALVAVLFLVGVGSALGYVTESPNAILAPGPGELANDLPRPSLNGARLDTVYFGGDDGTGKAFLNGVWDWDTIVTDPLQGWTTKDMTEDPATYFYRVNAASFAPHGDGCTPMFGHGLWQIWCGVHEDAANLRDFVAGMGYANNSCQQANSPTVAITTGQSATVNYIYFNDSEVGFDYTYTYLNCYDDGGELITQFEIGKFDGRDGTYDAPSNFASTTAYAELDPLTRSVQVELRFKADGGWSDEDGLWATDCGPFAADDVTFSVGAMRTLYDFESGEQGWTFQRCPGKGAFMAVWPEATWSQWLIDAGVSCNCPISGNVLGFCQEQLVGLPAFPVLHHEQGFSGIVERGIYQPPDYNAVYVRMAGYTNLPHKAGTFVRPGFTLYPYITEYNPVPHWSPRDGQDVWNYTGDDPYCAYNAGIFNWDLTHPPDGNPIPPTWDRMKFIFETNTDCVAFQVPTGVCTEEGLTLGSPLLDRVQVGLTFAPDAPSITPETGMLIADGFGQKFPTYLEPGDVGNCNASYDISRDYVERNDWHGDTVSVSGPTVIPTSPRRWLARFCVKVERKGARQDMIPGYQAWKRRLAYAGNPEADYVCVVMDSVQISQGPYKNKFLTYFHESEPGFDTSHPDYTHWQEIMPDSIWTPGTKLNYKFQARWYDGTEYGDIGPWEFEILPNMQLQAGEEYAVEWPCVLYIDRFNRGSEYYIVPLLQQMGLDYDKFDALDGGSNYDTSIKRTFGGTYFNPGGWGNNGMTTDQALGYRLILFSLGTLGLNSCELGDWDILEIWLTDSRCGLGDIRRGLIMNGDEIAATMQDPVMGSPGFVNNILGTTYSGSTYRDANGDGDYCVMLEPASGALFAPAPPGIGLYGNGCPNEYNYAVLGLQAGIQNTVGNLRYWSYQGGGNVPYVNYAQVVRTKIQSQVANWKSVVDGFSFHHVSERNCLAEDCSPDSACIVRGAMDLMGPELLWMTAGGSPFVKWRYPCEDVAVGDDSDTHVSGPVDFLYAARPNPFRGTATIRFTLATPTNVNVSIFDVSGRLVRTLVDGAMGQGEHNQTWDGADNGGHRVGGGIFWMKMHTGNGYQSSMRIVVVPR